MGRGATASETRYIYIYIYTPNYEIFSPSWGKIREIVPYCGKIIKDQEQIKQYRWKKDISKNIKKQVLWIFVLSPWIHVRAAKSFSRWTKSIDYAEIFSKTCSECFSGSYSSLKFQFYKTAFSLHFQYFLKYIFSIDFIIIFMIFVHFSAIIHYFHDYFATWSQYFATWYLFRASGALPSYRNLAWVWYSQGIAWSA